MILIVAFNNFDTQQMAFVFYYIDIPNVVYSLVFTPLGRPLFPLIEQRRSLVGGSLLLTLRASDYVKDRTQ